MAREREVIVERSTTAARPFEGMRVSWGGILGGVLVVIGTLLLLTTLGLAIGISAADPRSPDFGAMGTGAAIWSSLSLLVALFLGGLAATRMSMVWDRFTGMLQGTLVWVLSLIVVLYLAANGIGLVVGNAFGLVSNVAQGVGSAAVTGGSQVLSGLSSGNVQQIIDRLNDPQTASRIATALGLSESEVRSALQALNTRVQDVQNNPTQVVAEVRQTASSLLARADERLAATAAEVQPEATTTAWITFLALVLSLAAAVIGSAVGRRRVTTDAGAPRRP